MRASCATAPRSPRSARTPPSCRTYPKNMAASANSLRAGPPPTRSACSICLRNAAAGSAATPARCFCASSAGMDLSPRRTWSPVCATPGSTSRLRSNRKAISPRCRRSSMPGRRRLACPTCICRGSAPCRSAKTARNNIDQTQLDFRQEAPSRDRLASMHNMRASLSCGSRSLESNVTRQTRPDDIMPTIDRIERFADELTAIRRDLHAHPEIGFEEIRTSGIVAEKLAQWGVEVHRGVGGTGVVGVLKGKGNGGRRIGLRADMDALPMEENTNLKWRSTVPGRFHGCGHDGHTTILLGAARYLAETRDFDGTVHFIFQPAEEGLGGARAMIKDGLFDKFPCDEIYGLHNAPDLDHGELAILPGPAMAGADFFDITISGYGAHGAMPERSKDAVVIAMTLGQALQTIVSRNVDPLQAAVLSITQIHAGSAYNVIPGEAKLCGTVRAFSDEVRELIRERMRSLCAGLAAAFEVEIKADIRDI